MFTSIVKPGTVFTNIVSAPRAASSNPRYIVYSACLSGRSYLASGVKSLTFSSLVCSGGAVCIVMREEYLEHVAEYKGKLDNTMKEMEASGIWRMVSRTITHQILLQQQWRRLYFCRWLKKALPGKHVVVVAKFLSKSTLTTFQEKQNTVYLFIYLLIYLFICKVYTAVY